MSSTNVWNRVSRRSASSHARLPTQRKPVRQGRSVLPRLEALEDRTLPSTLTVTSPADDGDGSLRAAIAAGQDGDQIVFDQSLQGQTITLTSGQLAISHSLDIEGPGADNLTLSGNHASRVFDISGGVSVTIAGLTITNGLANGSPGWGGGIRNIGSHLTVVNDILSNNEASGGVGDNPNGNGGAIRSNLGELTVSHCLFLNNLVRGTNPVGGGIACNGPTTVTDSTFRGNQTIGENGGAGQNSRGGGIFNANGTLMVANCTFTDNQAIGGSNNTGTFGVGSAYGAGIANADAGILFLTGSAFTGNLVLGGSNNTNTNASPSTAGTASGGGLGNVGVATVTDSTFEDNEVRAGNGNMGGSGFIVVGLARGGAISSSPYSTPGSLTAINVTLRHNRAIGGAENAHGYFMGGAFGGGLECEDNRGAGGAGSTVTISNSTITDNVAIGGQGAAGSNGGDAEGGGLASTSGATLTVSGSTISDNRTLGGVGGAGGNGGRGLGGLFNDGPSTYPTSLGAPTILTVLGDTVSDNEAQGGPAGAGGSSPGSGAGGGIASAGILAVLGSTLVHNAAVGGTGADGGSGVGGGLSIAGGTASVLTTTISHNQAVGGNGDTGGNGGDGLGGGAYVAAGTVLVDASEISYNQAVGGSGDSGGADGDGVGGGVYNLGTFLFDAATLITHNHASTSNDDCFGC